MTSYYLTKYMVDPSFEFSVNIKYFQMKFGIKEPLKIENKQPPKSKKNNDEILEYKKYKDLVKKKSLNGSEFDIINTGILSSGRSKSSIKTRDSDLINIIGTKNKSKLSKISFADTTKNMLQDHVSRNKISKITEIADSLNKSSINSTKSKKLLQPPIHNENDKKHEHNQFSHFKRMDSCPFILNEQNKKEKNYEINLNLIEEESSDARDRCKSAKSKLRSDNILNMLEKNVILSPKSTKNLVRIEDYSPDKLKKYSQIIKNFSTARSTKKLISDSIGVVNNRIKEKNFGKIPTLFRKVNSKKYLNTKKNDKSAKNDSKMVLLRNKEILNEHCKDNSRTRNIQEINIINKENKPKKLNNLIFNKNTEFKSSKEKNKTIKFLNQNSNYNAGNNFPTINKTHIVNRDLDHFNVDKSAIKKKNNFENTEETSSISNNIPIVYTKMNKIDMRCFSAKKIKTYK